MPLLAGMVLPLKYHSMLGVGLPSNSHVYTKFSIPTTSSLSSAGFFVMVGNSVKGEEDRIHNIKDEKHD